MKRMTIILAGLLILGMTSGGAFAETSSEDSVATLANDAGLSLEGLRRDNGLFYAAARASVADEAVAEESDAGLLTCHFTDGCGYAVNRQVMIDVQYSIVSVDDPERTVASSASVGDRLAPNVMLGLHFNF